MTESIRLERIAIRGEFCRLKISSIDKALILKRDAVGRHRLVEGIILTESQLNLLESEAELLACDLAAGRMLARRAYSSGEFKVKLKQKGFLEDSIKAAAKKFSDLGQLDDLAVARRLVEATLNKNPAGRAYLAGLLKRKMIGRSIAERVIDSALADHDEVDLAVASLRKRWRLLKDLELERAQTKAYNYLARRGIAYGAARAAFEKLLSEE